MAKQSTSDKLPGLPTEPVQQLVSPIARFLHVEAASGIALLACTFVALALANSSWSDAYLNFWKIKAGFKFGELEFVHSLKHWVDDALMAIFFFVIGMEVKREIAIGELRELRNAILPIAGAIGGMVVPAGIYLAMQFGEEGARGWGIPMATDIAFVVGCMAVLGSRVPHALRIMLLSLAIADDIGAILVIAVGYTDTIHFQWLIAGVIGIGAVLVLARIGVRAVPVYAVVGVFVWFAFHESGVHATIAGVILGLITPASSWINRGLMSDIVRRAGDLFQGDQSPTASEQYGVLRHLESASREALSPLIRLETTLHPWVSFFIMPIFALANAGVALQVSDLGSSTSLAVMLGLVVGKPVGVVFMCWLAVTIGATQLPKGVNWGMIAGGGMLAGIGFAMALFIANLALDGDVLDQAKVGVLAGSVLSAIGGMLLLIFMAPGSKQAADE